MDIQITPETRISELKASFSKRFPHLKIEFFSGNRRQIVGDDQLDVEHLSGRKPQGSLHITGLTTVAEGVEHAAQNELLRELGCELAQGFLISRPVTAAELAPLLQADAPAGQLTASSCAAPVLTLRRRDA